MGNQNTKGIHRMAISAMSNVTHIEKRELQAISLRLKEITSSKVDSACISRKELTETLVALGINPNDCDIIDKLYTMYDKAGTEQVNWRDFLVGMTPLISGSLRDKIESSLSLYNVDSSNRLKGSDVLNALRQMNTVASYFGDPVLSDDQLGAVVTDTFDARDGSNVLQSSYVYVDYVDKICSHELLQLFLAGGGTVLYGGN